MTFEIAIGVAFVAFALLFGGLIAEDLRKYPRRKR